MSERLRSEIRALWKPAWKPVVEEGDGELIQSKFSGRAALRAGEEWPRCANCSKPLQLFLQLNLDFLPDEVMGDFGDGLLQLFYCLSDKPRCEDVCEASLPFSKSVVVRIVPVPPEGGKPPGRPAERRFPPRAIVGWEPLRDLPVWEEIEERGIKVSEAEHQALEELEVPHGGDKLAGWPSWIQGVEYPGCRTCGRKMRLVFQIEGEDNLPCSFGDLGCGHVTQCPDHKDVLAFGWACT